MIDEIINEEIFQAEVRVALGTRQAHELGTAERKMLPNDSGESAASAGEDDAFRERGDVHE